MGIRRHTLTFFCRFYSSSRIADGGSGVRTYPTKAPYEIADAFCARQMVRSLNRHERNLQVLAMDLHYRLTTGNSSEIKRNRSVLSEELKSLMQLHEIVAAAKYGTTFSDESVELIARLHEEISSVDDWLVCRKDEHQKAIRVLKKVVQELRNLRDLSEQIIADCEDIDWQKTPAIHTRIEDEVVRFNILHLTDVHFGQPNAHYSVENILTRLEEDLTSLPPHISSDWDAIAFTGDAAFKGDPAEFERFDRFIDDLYEILGTSSGAPPKLLSVPGNHDLTFQDENQAHVKTLLTYHNDDTVPKELWGKKDESQFYPVIKQAFDAYSNWWNSRKKLWPDHYVDGILPGDFTGVLEKKGVRLGIVGLNSSFLQITKGEDESFHKGKLAIDHAQLIEACGDTGVKWFRKNDLNILLTHHSEDWYHPKCQKQFEQEILQPNRFAIHLCGHEHDPKAISYSVGGGGEKRRLLGHSLYGRRTYKNGEIERMHGYAAVQFSVSSNGKTKKLRLWPRIATPSLSWTMVPNYMQYYIDRAANDQGTESISV